MSAARASGQAHDHGASSAPTRRTILRALGVGGLAAGLGALTWRSVDQGVFSAGEGPAYDAWRDLRHLTGVEALVGAAVLAASAHNMQNWSFAVAADRIELFDDRTRSLGVVDPVRREAELGLGCALANLELAGPPAGFSVRTDLLGSNAPQGPAARATLAPIEPADGGPLFEAIPTRHSDRGAYPAEVPGLDVLARLARTAVDGADGVQIRWLTEADDVDRSGSLLVAAARALTEDAAMSRDNFAWFRSDWDEVQRRRDGLTLDAQALTGLTTVAGKMLPATSRVRGDAMWVDLTREVHTATARAYGLVIADRSDRGARIHAGRALQRLHLALTAEGWSMQHLNQLIEMSDRERVLGAPATHGAALRALGGTDDVVAMLRVGRPSGDARRSPRRPAREVLR